MNMNTRFYTTISAIQYTTGIYENCSIKIQRNKNRYRVKWDAVQWKGNTGCLVDKTRYFTIAEGRKLLKQYRTMVVDFTNGKYDISGSVQSELIELVDAAP